MHYWPLLFATHFGLNILTKLTVHHPKQKHLTISFHLALVERVNPKTPTLIVLGSTSINVSGVHFDIPHDVVKSLGRKKESPNTAPSNLHSDITRSTGIQSFSLKNSWSKNYLIEFTFQSYAWLASYIKSYLSEYTLGSRSLWRLILGGLVGKVMNFTVMTSTEILVEILHLSTSAHISLN